MSPSRLFRTIAFVVSLGAASPAASQIPFEVLAKATGGSEPDGTIVVLRSGEEFDALWRRLVEREPRPIVDFERHMVVAYFLGRRPSQGNAVDVERVSIRAGEMNLGIRTWGDCGGGQFPVNRVVLISTMRWPHSIRAEKRIVECGSDEFSIP